MASTRKITVTNAAAVPITVLRPCTRVMIGEDASVAGYPTSPFLLQKPTQSDAQIEFPAGAYYNFFADRGGFASGNIIGYVQLPAAGSTTFFIDEGGSEIGAS
jgi:hypothetical protein